MWWSKTDGWVMDLFWYLFRGWWASALWYMCVCIDAYLSWWLTGLFWKSEVEHIGPIHAEQNPSVGASQSQDLCLAGSLFISLFLWIRLSDACVVIFFFLHTRHARLSQKRTRGRAGRRGGADTRRRDMPTGHAGSKARRSAWERRADETAEQHVWEREGGVGRG